MPGEVRILALFGGMAMLGSERGNLEALTGLRDGGATVKLMVSDSVWAKAVREELAARGFACRPCPYLLLPRPERRFNPLFNYPVVIARASLILLDEIIRFRPTHLYASSQLFVLNFLPVLAVTRIPLVYRCGDKPIRHSRLFRFIWWFLARRGGPFVAISRFIADLLERNGVAASKISVIYNKPPTRLAQPPAPGPRATGLTFVFMGQINETKGPHLLIEAFERASRRHPDARLIIAGRISTWEGDQWARDLRDRVAADPWLSGRVSFPGFIEDVPGLLAQCDVQVAPTVTEEPLGNVVMEAKQAGIASIVFPSGGMPEMIEQDVDGHVCRDRTAAALEAALDVYLDHPEAVIAQGAAARASLRRLGVERFVEDWKAVVAPGRRTS